MIERDDSGADRLEQLVFECLERMAEDGEGVLEELCAANPDEAAALRREIENLGRFGLAGERLADRLPERLGEFRILEQLGRGGMGVVYVAVQEPLGRRVALKVVRPELLYFPGQRERFLREQDAVARLQHPGIVPIYTTGETDGLPWFAMELFDGASLAEVLLAMPAGERSGEAFCAAIETCCGAGDRVDRSSFAGSWPDVCAGIARQIADALEHAHGRGVVHRDVKPSNIVITRNGRAMLIDFGLASREGAVQLTRTGSQLGSLPYMSPEQLRGVEVSDRSDLYSLGVTLFEALTGELVFAGEDTEDVRRRILAGDVRIDRGRLGRIGWDLRMVCRVAMDPDPARRYATAADLARDLGNVLQRRPIEARPPGPWLRTLRWAQRHATASVAAVVTVALSLVAAIVFLVREQSHGVELERERDEAQARFADVRGIATSFLFEFDAMIVDVAGATRARELVVERALALFERLAEASRSDDKLAREIALARAKVAEIQAELGQLAAAMAQFDLAIAALEARDDGSVAARTDLWNVLRHRGSAERLAGRRADSLGTLGRALEVAEWLFAAAPDADNRRVLAATLEQVGKGESFGGEHRAALQRLQRAVALYRELAAVSDATADRFALTTALSSLHNTLHALGESAAAQSTLAESVRIGEALVTAEPDNARYRERLAMSLAIQARRLAGIDLDRALERVRRAALIAERGHAIEPDNMSRLNCLLSVLCDEGDILDTKRDLEGSLRVFDRVVGFAELPAGVGNALIEASLARALELRGNALSQLERGDEAKAAYGRAVAVLAGLVARDPGDMDFQVKWIAASGSFGIAQAQTGDLPGAIATFRSAISSFEQLSPPGGLDRQAVRALVTVRNNLAFGLSLAADDVSALAENGRAVALLERTVQRDGADLDMRQRLEQALRARVDFAAKVPDEAVGAAARRRLAELQGQ